PAVLIAAIIGGATASRVTLAGLSFIAFQAASVGLLIGIGDSAASGGVNATRGTTDASFCGLVRSGMRDSVTAHRSSVARDTRFHLRGRIRIPPSGARLLGLGQRSGNAPHARLLRRYSSTSAWLTSVREPSL